MRPDSKAELTATITRLERRLAAQERTIEALMTQVENRFATADSVYATLEQNVALERVVRNKTLELEARRAELAATLEKLSHTQAQLLQAQKLESIGSLAAGIAHEINTPTQFVGDNLTFLERAFEGLSASLEASLDLLRRSSEAVGPVPVEAHLAELEQTHGLGFLREEIPGALRSAQDGVARISRIVGAMKEFSHPGERERSLANLNRAIENTVTVARGEYKFWADVRLDLDPGLREVPCLVGELNQVILNLIVNAADAIRDTVQAGECERGTIVIQTRQGRRAVVIRISDTGSGIPEELRSRVYDPFFTTKEVGKGTGQGLAIAHDVVVNKHEGSIDFESTVGQGTTFIITLPLASATGGAGEEERRFAA